MNHDDPKFTAFALDELDPAERAEIEQMLRDNPELAREVEETRNFAAQLRGQLQSEPAEPLHEEQRAEVLATAVPVNAAKIARFPARAGVWLALAACVLLGFAWAVLFPAFDGQKKASVTRISEVRADARRADAQPSGVALKDGSQVQIALADEPAAAPEVLALDDLSQTLPVLDVGAKQKVTLGLEPKFSKDALGQSATPMVSTPAFQSNKPLLLSAAKAPGASPAPETEKLLAEAQGFYGTGRYDLAMNRGRQVLAVDSENVRAKEVLQKVEGARTEFKVAGLNEARSRPLMRMAAPQENTATRSTVLLAPAAPAVPTASRPLQVGRVASAGTVLAGKEFQSEQEVALVPADRGAFNGSLKQLEDRGERSYLTNQDTGSDAAANTASYEDVTDNAFLKVTDAPLSTFSIDVDTASYANVRRFLNGNTLPPKAAVRIEELINYFSYDYPQPEGDAPFSVNMEVAACPWAPEHRLVRVGLRGRELARASRPASNLVFLVDVSGSMQPENKLPLLKRSLQLMVDQLGERDRVAIVVYAGAAGCVLDSTTSKEKIRNALDRLESGGSTHGSAGLQLAYELAEKHFIKGGTNRVLLATDGDWNVGVTEKGDLWKMIEQKAKSGVFLTVLGFGMDNLKDDMLEKLADKGNGNYAYIDTLNEGRKVLVDELGATLVTIAKDVKIQVEFNPAQVGAYRLIGYENRALAAKDFNDDAKDAGEIGAGHSVTAFYEIIPAGKELPSLTQTDELKYQKAKIAATSPAPELVTINPENKEMLTLKLRSKAPDSDKSTLREFPLKDGGNSFANSSRDFRFAAAVAGYGMLLRQSPYKGDANWGLVHELAVEGKGEDRTGYRTEFVGLVERARAMMR